jgi:prolyl-tRNA synthetase
MPLKNKKEKNFSEWYTEVIQKAELADHSAVSGCLVYRPYAYAIWERIVAETDKRLKATGVQNAYFPLLIPKKLLQKEQAHVKGFSPEVAWVTEAGHHKLEEPLAIRPTSETIMYDSYSKWIRSWRDLPLRINQWNNVVRWEFKHPTPFLRGREFLWNEGHSAFATERDAVAEKNIILGVYRDITKNIMSMPGILVMKTPSETFAGATETFAIEHMMPEAASIQGPDFHLDGQTFAKAFDIQFLDEKGKKNFVWQNTWAITTREIGALIAIHGDDAGLVLPPKIAPIQIVIIPIYDNDSKAKVLSEAKKLEKTLAEDFRVLLDDRDKYTPGWKFNEWEIKGVPLRIEIGPRDIAAKQVTIARRDGQKKSVLKKITVKEITSMLDDIQASLLKKAESFVKAHYKTASSYTELKKLVDGNFVESGWCGEEKCEQKAREELNAKVYILPDKRASGKCIVCGKPAKHMVYIAKSY